MLKISFSKNALKFIQKLPPKQGRQIGVKIQDLRINPEPHDSIQLKGHAPLRRTDVGEYRIIYYAEGDTLFIPLIGKRNDDEVYKKLRRMR